MQHIPLILSSVFLNALAQIFIRQGMLKLGSVSFNMEQIWNMALSVFTNMYLLSGMFSYGISIILWMIVLSKVNVSLAYPFLSVGYVVTAVLAYLIFKEPLTVQKIFGIAIICLGVVILTYSKDFVR
jgi:spaO